MRLFILSCLVSGLWLLTSRSAQALVDTNANEMTDLWEKLFNNDQLFPPSFDPQADPDGDGWKNIQEATAGTNPFDGNPPTGLVRPEISYTPGTFDESDLPPSPPSGDGGGDPFTPGTAAPAGPPRVLIDPPLATLTWPTIAGKTYQVFVSENLVAWSPASAIYMGSGEPQSFQSENVYSDGTFPPKVFLRIVIGDTDSDTDTLSDWEENQLGLDPFSPDTDRDGIPDNTDPLSKISATLADPDGLGLAHADLLIGLKANWTFEETSIPLGTLFGKNEARAENHAPATTPAWPVLVPFNLQGQPLFARRGFVSHGLPIADKSIYGDGKIFTGITNSFTLSFWHRFQKDSIKNGNAIYKSLWSLSDCNFPTNIQSNFFGIRRKSSTEEEIYLGAYTWDSNGGNPNSSLLGKNFTRPLGTADDGKWHQHTIVRTAGKYTLLIDGDTMPGLDNQTVPWLTIPLTKTTPTTSSDYNYDWNTFGRLAPNLPQNQTLGTFDRIRLWSRPLDSTEQQKLYHEDLDNDGLWDLSENSTEIWNDLDKDNIREQGEYQFRSSPFIWEKTDRDTDGDGLTDLDEQNIYHTDLAHPDTDGDLLPDGWEILHNLDPLSAVGANGTAGDPDGDGLDNLGEFSFVSDPHVKDSDGDGTEDGAEVLGNSHPSDPSDNGQPLPPEKSVSIKLGIGDQSDSESEDYNLNIYRIDPLTGDEIRFHTHRSGGHGSYAEKTRAIFHKGQTYTFQIDWQSSTQGSSNYNPNAPDKGPDYDYTFKVEPQGSPLGKFIDGYDPRTGTVNPNAPLLADHKQDAATAQPAFEENYETRRAAQVAPTLVWEAIEGFENLSDHIDPWSTTGEKKGKRIFPGQKDPNTHRIQHKLHLVATGGLKGIECYVKSLDIDDSTSEPFDTEGIVDSNDAGDDNRPDYLTTNLTGQFWDNQLKKWGGATSHKPFDEDGRASFDFRVGMQPGNNYRAVASISDTQAYANVQTSNSAQNTYLGPELTQNGNAIASVPLTVWRRLWVENDSMAAVPVEQSGVKLNDLKSEVGIAGFTDRFLGAEGTSTWLVVPPVADFSSFVELDVQRKGRIVFQNATHQILKTAVYGGAGGSYHVSISGNHTSVPLGESFKIYDDDDYGLLDDPLPRRDLVNEQMKAYFRSSFVEITNADAYQSPLLIDFKNNEDVSFLNPNTVVDDKKDLTDRNSCWICPITAAYQGREDEDHDGEESFALGETAPHGSYSSSSYYDHSTVFIEGCRESYGESLTNPNPQSVANARLLLGKWIVAAVSHEMGHQPADQIDDHPEGGLMSQNMNDVSTFSPENAKFRPKTVLRFREAERWSK